MKAAAARERREEETDEEAAEPAQAEPEAGEAGQLTLRMTAAKEAELTRLREARDKPTKVSTFKISASAVVGGARKSSWSAEIERTLDDVAGSPRVTLPSTPAS